MAWPLASQFSAMLQRPAMAMRDPVLRQYAVERDRFRQPRPWAGSFAVVYKGIPLDDGKPVAIRVFTTESPERRERYDAISQYLKARRPSCLVDFEYRDESIRAAGHAGWFPLILMDWVEGETLLKWVGSRCLEWNSRAIAAAAARWLDVVAELEEMNIAHGDLQHGNVMVTPDGRLMLVDYDGMCVPALVGRRNLEVGVQPYQHPERNENTLLRLDMDRFSAMVVYVALRALAADPGLWHRHVEALAYDKLLFRGEDLRAPGSSRLIAELAASPEEAVRELTEGLLELLRIPMSRIPQLGQLAGPSFRRIERLLAAQQWDAAVELLNRRGRFRDAPPHLKPLIAQAYENVCRQQSWADFQKVSHEINERCDRRLLRKWNEAVFAGFPPAELQRPRLEAARRRVAALDRLKQLDGQSAGGVSLEEESSLLSAAASLPEGYAHGLESRVAQARARVAAVGQLKAAERLPAVEAASDRAAQSEALREALQRRDRVAFSRRFDARLIRRYGDRFARHAALLCRWTESDVLPLESLGLGPAVGRASVVCVDQAAGAYRLRWTWPPQRFCEECVLAVCQQSPGPGSDPRQQPACHRLRITRSGWENGGGSRLVYAEPAWRGGYFVVWAMVDLGIRLLASHPLVLGQIHTKEVFSARQDKGDRG